MPGQLEVKDKIGTEKSIRAINQSATEVLAGFIVSEAKRLLLYTSNTISEIAFKLEFIDASHFIKYFKRTTGQTPQAFRLDNE